MNPTNPVTDDDRVVAGVFIPWTQDSGPVAPGKVEETTGLTEALDCDLAFVENTKLRRIRPSHLLSEGLVASLREKLEAGNCGLCIIDAVLSPVQQRNLEKDLQTKVVDRTGLILEIFGLRAQTKEGRIQVELARLSYERSRLVRTWTHLERQRGGAGFLSGPGESQLEADRRMLDLRLMQLRADLEAVRRTRGVQRVSRTRGERPLVVLVGYTNAGKSTLFNALTQADVFAKDMPFATLDPTTRSVKLPISGRVSFVDTVGFISDLPTHLIESFKATLEEVVSADLLLHVRDRASVSDQDQKKDVLKVLKQIEASTDGLLPPIIEVWNKSDQLDAEQLDVLTVAQRSASTPAFLTSGLNGRGVEGLLKGVDESLSSSAKVCQFELTPSEGRVRAWLFENAKVLEEKTLSDGSIYLSVKISEVRLRQFENEFPDISTRIN